jgi:hypothetical protein
MKATIEIDDELYRQVKVAAAIQGRKVKDLVAEGLRTVLRSPHAGPRTRRTQLPIVKSKKPGTLRLGNEAIAEIEARLEETKRGQSRSVNNCASSLFQVGKYEGKLALSCPATQ